jgi:DNA-binding transcriptional LysR family regulator
MKPLELRRVRYFVAVAQELHFGRAAERLCIVQPVLSRQIQKLEEELGVELMTRTNRSVELTLAGRQLLEDGVALLEAADATRSRVQAAAGGLERLAIAFWVGDFFAPAVRAFHATCPMVEVQFVRIYWQDQVSVLRDGRADVGFLHGPVYANDLRIIPVRREPRVAVVPAHSQIADMTSVGLADLAGYPVIHHAGADPIWDAFHTVDPRPDGRHPAAGPAVHNLEEKLANVAAGRGISFIPAFAAATVTHAEVAFVPVRDIPPSQISVAWVGSRRSVLIKTFIDRVRAQRPWALSN